MTTITPTTELKRTISSAGSQTKWGASAWVKLMYSNNSQSQPVYCSSKSDTTANLRGIFVTSDDKIQVAFYDGSYQFQVETNRLLRDQAAFYHLCVAYDSSQVSAADRIKIWVNGVLETSFSTSSYPAQDATNNFFGTDITQLIGSLREGSSICNACVISHIHVTDGYCYDASTYGETDATTGAWKIKTNPTGVTYGTNGFFLLKNNASLVDQSGQGNDFTLGSGTLTATVDNPSDNFCTLNQLYHDDSSDFRYSNGNTTASCVDTVWESSFGTLGFTKGKFYWEMKIEALNASNGYAQAGVQDIDKLFAGSGTGMGFSGNNTAYFTANNDSAGYEIDYRGGSNNNTFSGGSNIGDTGIDYSNGDVLGFAVDMDNRALYMHKNGTYTSVSSVVGVPTSGASKTGAVDIPTTISTCSPGVSIYGANAIMNFNFGNGVFKTTAVADEGTNASNIGKFEYDVPTGYTALSTKGLNI
jgi:hypothetical protein